MLADGGRHRPRVDLFLGGRCNNDCLFCNEGGRVGRRRVYSLAEARALLAKADGLDTVFLTGGEPTLNPDLARYVEVARESGAGHVALVTNGRRLQRAAFVDELLSAGVNEVRISIHGHDAALHEAHTRAKGSFAQVRRALVHLRERKDTSPHQLIVLVVVTSLNLAQVPAIYRWARDEGADRVGFGVVRPSGLAETHFAEVIPRYAAVGEVFRAFLGAMRLREDPVNVDSLPPCLVPEQAVFLGARMRLVSLGDGGRLLERDEFWEKTKGPPCERCLLRGSCEGVWEGYVARFGWDEFPTISRSPWEPDPPGRCAASRWTFSGADPPAPLLSLGSACNNACLVCGPPRMPGERAAPSSARDAVAGLERLARMGCERIRVGGGEPTLSPHLAEVLHAAARWGVRVELRTNARLLAYPRFVDRLRAVAPERLVTALHGPSAGTHDPVTRAEGSFRQTLRGLRNARRAGWPVDVVLQPPPDGVPASAPAWGRLRERLVVLGCRVVEHPGAG